MAWRLARGSAPHLTQRFLLVPSRVVQVLFATTLLTISLWGAALAGTAQGVDTASITEPAMGEWPSYGLDYREQRYSPLQQITPANLERLGLAWYADLDYNRGLEATPLVVDGIMYLTGAWSLVYAFDAASGELLWKYDPRVPKAWGKMACCDVVNRGVALYDGKVFVGTLDARLLALDAATGELLWETATADLSQPYTITGAPRVAKGKVFIGNGGAEYGVRGYVSAYDVDTGELSWRFYTVPGNPADGFEDDTQRMAAETWSGEWWRYGGGGTVWDSIVYDAELDQLYIGTGNGSPGIPGCVPRGAATTCSCPLSLPSTRIVASISGTTRRRRRRPGTTQPPSRSCWRIWTSMVNRARSSGTRPRTVSSS